MQKRKLNIINIEASQLLNDPEFLEIEAKSLSLIASKKLIKIRSSNDKILEIISKYLLNPENTCIIVLIAESLSPRSKLRSYFEKHTSATSIPCYLDDKNTISLPIDEYTIYSSNNYSPKNDNILAENVLSNQIKSMHKDSKYSNANFTANQDIGILYGLVIIIGCCGQW